MPGCGDAARAGAGLMSSVYDLHEHNPWRKDSDNVLLIRHMALIRLHRGMEIPPDSIRAIHLMRVELYRRGVSVDEVEAVT